MQLLKIAVCLSTLLLTQGCTVLGFASDVSLHSMLDNIHEINQAHSVNDEDPLFFTHIGLKQDIKIVNEFLQDVAKANQAKSVQVPDERRLFPANYANKWLCKQLQSELGDCHDADYYQQFYIKVADIQSPLEPSEQISDN
jgi:hypothetical protein